ncbi:MAG: two-component regulator propeller domain-containing protein [Bacteroidota bacterium]
MSRVKFIRSFVGIMVIISLLCVTLKAQPTLPAIDAWRVHAAFSNNNCLEEVAGKIYVGNNSAIFTFDKSERSTDVLSRVTGLSDVNVKLIKYHAPSRTMIIGYDNLNIDLMQDGVVYNIPDILNKRIIGDKILYNISVIDQTAYLSCSFGIVLIDIPRKRLVDSYVNLGPNGTNLSVTDVAVFNGKMYASSVTGIYAAPLTSLNLSDYRFWQLAKTSTFSNHMEMFRNQLYAVVDSTITVFDGNTWSPYNSLGKNITHDMRVNNNRLVITLDDQIVMEDAQGVISSNNQRFAQTAILSKEKDLFMLVPNQYLIRVDNESQALEFLAPSGPFSTTGTRMSFGDGKLWLAAGGVNGFGIAGGWGPQYNNNKFSKFENNQWYSYVSSADPKIVNARDFIDVAIHPVTRNAFMGSFGYGIVEMNGETVVNAYDSLNSSLRAPNTGTLGPVNVSGLTFDKNNNLWVSNSDAFNPISVMEAETKNWRSFSLPLSVDRRFGFITIDDQNNKWIFSTRGLGIIVYNSGSSVMDASDDQFKVLTKDKENGFLPSNTVLCITKDQKGELWTGTDQGLCIFRSPENVFKNGALYDAEQLVIKTGLVYSNFLGNTPINCIKVDAANRKWIGTANGVWLVSPDGYSVIHNFNMSNSPLLSNIILEIGINDETGEVFFVTEKGIISYMSNATEAKEVHSNVLVYPNPVGPEYTGLIAIKGLVNNAFVKITDIKGQMIYETRANGGTATWDGRNFTGKRTATGVYLIYSTNAEGTETNVAKVVFVN